MNDHLIITISREHGTGGREIGRKVAEALGIPFYDNYAMAEMFPENSESGKKYFQTSGETTVSEKQYGRINTRYLQYNSLNEEMFRDQSEVMRRLAEQGPAVFVGRCADVVLAEDCSRLFRVFLGADLETRTKNLMARHEVDEEKARKEIHQMDKSRASYYAYYTEQRWGQREHYDLCIDAGRMQVPAIVAAIKDLASAI